MILDIIRKIDILESFDSKTIIETFSFEERRVLFTQVDYLFNNSYSSRQEDNKLEAFITRVIEEKIIVFTKEEMNQIKEDDFEINDEEFLYSQMEDEELIQIFIEHTSTGAYRAYKYLKSDESIYKIIELYINDETPEHVSDYIAEVVSSAKSDEFKIKCIQLLSKLPRRKRINDYEKSIILQSLSDDDTKITNLWMVSNEYKTSVITSMDSDDTKVRYINLFSRGKGDIIKSLDDDELKEFYFKKYYRLINSDNRAIIIASFEDEDLIRKYLPLINGNHSIMEFIYYCSNEDVCMEAARKLTSDKYIVNAIGNIRKSEYKLELFKKLRNLKTLFKDHEYLLYDFEYNELSYIMSQLNDEQQIQVIRNVHYPDNLLLITQIRNFDKAMELLGHIEDYCFGAYDEELNPIIDYLAEKLNFKKERLQRLTSTTGALILKYLTNKNIIDCLNLSDEDFEKYMELIKPEHQQMDMGSVNDVLNAVLNRRFKKEKKEDNEIFQEFQMAIETKDKAKIRELIARISTLVNVTSQIEDLNDFIEQLVSRNVQTIDQLHDLTQEYIRIAKDNYVREKITESRKAITSTVVDRGEYLKIILASYDTNGIIRLINSIKDKVPESELQELIEDRNLLTQLIEYKKDPKKYGQPSKELKRHLKNFNILLNYIYRFRSPNITGYNLLTGVVATTETAPKQYQENIIFMVTELNVSELRDTIFKNEEVFQELLIFIEKYKILGWTDSVKDFASSSGLDVYNSTISALISNFEAIMRNLNEKVAKGEIPKATISHIIDLAACYDSDSLIYKIIFGRDNFVLLKNNPGPNKSDLNAEERMQRALEFIKRIKVRDSITTPPIDKDYKLSNNRELHVRLGHVNSLDNLTYGEKTGACMRIGGAGNSLFEFCLLNKNGFHIELSNPKTGEFVSRVSGFRNGNTIFLNQLRYSKDPSYKNDDLIETIKLVAKDIIELSKKSDYPIDNVVISHDYAFSQSKEKVTDLEVDSIKKGYEQFYTDVSSRAIILATSSEDQEFVPVTLGTKGLPEYEPLRERMRIYKDEEATIKMNEMIALDEYLSGKPIEEIEPKMDFDINTCYIGNDWYISISNDGQVTTYIMQSCRNKEKAEKEVKKVLTIIKEKSRQQIELLANQEDYSSSSSMHM